jgi:hypothetical protein
MEEKENNASVALVAEYVIWWEDKSVKKKVGRGETVLPLLLGID